MLLPSTTGQRVHATDDWLVRKDGSMIPVTCTAVPIQAQKGRGCRGLQ